MSESHTCCACFTHNNLPRCNAGHPSESPTSGEGQQTPTELDLGPIKRRWSRNGGMGNSHGPEDYTDAGCRVLAEYAFDDVAAVLAEVERLRSQLDDARGIAARLEQELDDKTTAAREILVDAAHPPYNSDTGERCRIYAHAILDAAQVLAGPSSVAEFEALGTPIEEGKD